MMDHPVQLTYLDNAATTFPKPREVLRQMTEIYSRLGVSPGRGGYDLAVEASEFVEQTRRKVANFFGASDPQRVIFTANATDALNLVIQGVLQPGDHAVATRLEHNSVLRPLDHLRQRGLLEYDLVPFNAGGFIDPDDVIARVRSDTRLVIITHASNVLGTVQPVAETARMCAQRGVPVVIDAAQSAGKIPIDMQRWGIAAVAFTGHKSLCGPSGIGGLVAADGFDIRTTRFGGTGIESRSLTHTQSYPHRLEAGTINLLGIAGLSAGLDFILAEDLDAVHQRGMALLTRLRNGLAQLPDMDLYCAENLDHHMAVLTVNVKGMDPEDVGAILDGDFNIAVRTGLHCAPLVHEDLNTSPRGGVRFSLGRFNTNEDIDWALAAMGKIAHRHRGA
jgi:cysteine desulfurase / selenocysteine lyase